ncbi:MAG: RsmE family RNA methyltransferase [Chloroflexota bacterium]
MHQFFVDATPSQRAVITGEQARQIATVLRLEPGERITLVADRTAHEVVLETITPTLVTGRVIKRRQLATELRFNLTLALPLLKGDRSEEVVEAVSQLGVRRIVPFVTSRSVVKELSPAKLERWQRIAREAAETAHRAVVPEIEPLVGWDALFDRLTGKIVVCWESEEHASLIEAATGNDISLVIGPEGGITLEEIGIAREHHAAVVSLGLRTLRAETAAIAAVAVLASRRE